MAQIIQLSPKRWKEYRELRLDALRNYPTAFNSPYEEEASRSDEMWQDELSNPNSFRVFAEDNGKLVGLMAVEWEGRRHVLHVAELYGVYVKSSYQHQGIGMMLWREASQLAKEKGIEKLWLDVVTTNDRAVSFYKKIGFKVLCTKEKQAKIEGKYYDKFYMEQFLI